MRFTPNDFVTVKLTDEGKRRAVAATDAFNDHIRKVRPNMTFRKEVPHGSDGIIRGQFWSVMRDIGGYDGDAGQDILFEWIECEPESKP